MRISRGGWVGTVVLAAVAACSSGDDSSFPPMGSEGGAPHYDGGGDDATSPAEGGPDGAADAPASAEAGGDGPVEASSAEEAGGEAAPGEAGEEAGVDASHQAGSDAGLDAATEAAAEAGVEAGPDAPPEAAVDAAPDAAEEASTGSDAGADASQDAPPDAISIVAPVCDGVIGANEYGGAGNQAASSSGQTWLMTWDDTNLYVAIESANIDEGNILYLAIAPGGSGGPSGGVASGLLYDSSDVTTLPFAAQLAVYAHDGYTEGRTASAGAWSTPNTTAVRLCDNATTQVREEVIPWSLIGGRPAAFGWTGYLAANGNSNPTGYIYGQMPTGNPSGAPANNDTFTQYYEVASSVTDVSTPFADVQ